MSGLRSFNQEGFLKAKNQILKHEQYILVFIFLYQLWFQGLCAVLPYPHELQYSLDKDPILKEIQTFNNEKSTASWERGDSFLPHAPAFQVTITKFRQNPNIDVEEGGIFT